MTDIDKINQVFAVLKMARDIEGVGAIKSFSFLGYCSYGCDPRIDA
jgi:hypothetical protein